MATVIDNLGRKIDSTNMSLGEIRSLLGTLMKTQVGPARPIEKTDAVQQQEAIQSAEIVKLQKILEQYTKDFHDDANEQKELLASVVENLQLMLALKDQKRAERKVNEKSKTTKEEKTMAKGINGLYQAGVVKRHSLASADALTHTKLDQVITSLDKIANALDKGMAGRGGNGGRGGRASLGAAGGGGSNRRLTKKSIGGGYTIQAPTEEDRKKDIFYMSLMEHMLLRISKIANDVQLAFLGWNAMHEITVGLVDEERKFTQEIRAVAYETTGATNESIMLQKQYEQIGDTVFLTGKNRTKFQESYKKALRSGMKDLKVAVGLTTAQLNAETQLGLEAGSLQDTFQSWNQSGRMTITQIDDMGRGIRDVSKFTGMTGDSLRGVVDSSKEFITSLRNAATLTSAASKNIIEIGANARKLGIEGEMQPLLKAMASSSNLLLESSNETKALLFTAAGSVGRIKDLMNGTILQSKSGIKDMAKGINNVLKRFGVESMEAIDQLSDTAKMRLNVSLKATMGIELGQLRSQYEALNEAGKGYGERLADIKKKMDQNITVEEKAALMEQARALKASSALNILTALDESAKGAKDMNQALETFGKRRKEFDGDLTAMGITATDNAGVVKGAIQNALDSVNTGLKKANKQVVKIDSSEIDKALQDPTMMRELTSRISKGQQELSTAQKSQLDPMSEMAQNLGEINDNIRQFTQTTFSMMFNSIIGKMVVVIGVLAGLVSSMALMAVSMKTFGEAIWDFFKVTEKWIDNRIDPSGMRHANKEAARAAKRDAYLKALAEKNPGGAGKTAAVSNAVSHSPMDMGSLGKSSAIDYGKKPFMDMNKLASRPSTPSIASSPSTMNMKALAKHSDIDYVGFRGIKDFVKSLKDTVSNSLNKARAKLVSISQSLVKTTDKWAVSISNGTEALARQVEANPVKAYTDLVKNSWKNTVKVTVDTLKDMGQRVKSGWGLVRTQSGLYINQIVRGANSGWTAVRQISLTGIKNSVRDAANFTRISGGMTRGLVQGFSAVTRMSGKAASGLLKMAGTMNPLGLLLLGIDGLWGGLEAGARAAKIFNKNQEDVTLNEEYAAKTAGLLTGVLNGLTFGIAGLILPMDAITDAIARFNAKIPILTIVLGPLMVVLEVLWGVVKGIALAIWEVIKGIGGLIMNIFNPVVEGLSDIFSTIGNMFSSFTGKAGGLTKAFRDIGGVVGVVSKTIQFVGTAIGWVLKAIGNVIGFILKTALKLIEGFTVVLEPVVEIFSAMWDGIMEVGHGLGDVFKGVWDALSAVGSGIYEIFSPILSIFGIGTKEGKGFFEIVKGIGWVLGKAVATLIKFVLQPVMVLAKIISGIGKLIQAVISLLKGDFSGAGKLVGEAIMGIIDAIIWPFKDVINIVKSMIEGVTGWFSYLYNWLVGNSLVPDLVLGIISWFAKLPGAVYGFVGSAIEAFANMASKIPKALKAIQIKILKLALYPFKSILNYFSSGFGDKAVDQIASTVGVIFDLLTSPFMLLTSIISGIGKIIQAVGKIFNGDFSGAVSLVKAAAFGVLNALLSPFRLFATYAIPLVKNAVMSVLNALMMPFKAVIPLIEAAAKNVMNAILAPFQAVVDYGFGLWDKMSEFGSWLFNSVTEKMSGFGMWLLDNTIGKMQELATWLYDSFTGVFKRVMDYIIGLIPGGGIVKNTVEAFSGTEQENQQRVAAEGSSVSGGIGRALGGVRDLSIGKTIGGVGEVGSAVLNAINPFNWFEEGTRKVEQTGVGVLHKNEMVVPAKDVQSLTAKGNGKFEGGTSFLSDLGSSLMSQISGIFDGNLFAGIGNMVSNSSIKKNTLNETNVSNTLKNETLDEKNIYSSSTKNNASNIFSEITNGSFLSDFGSSLMSQISGIFGSFNGFNGIKNLISNSSSSLNSSNSSSVSTNNNLTETPSSKAIETQLMKQQTLAETNVSSSLTHLVNEATTGDGLIVRSLTKANSDSESNSLVNNISNMFTGDSINNLIKQIAGSFGINEKNSSEFLKEVTGTNISQSGTNGQGILNQTNVTKSDHYLTKENNQSIGYRTANAVSARQIANQGTTLQVPMPQTNTTEQAANVGLTNLVVKPTVDNSLSSVVNPVADGETTNNQSVSYRSNNIEPVRPIIQPSPALPDIHTSIATDRASNAPKKTEVSSPELGEIASATNHQSTQLDMLVQLMEKMITLLEPKSQTISSSGGAPGDTSSREIVHKPANFYRNTVGLVTQTAGKAVLNLGPQKA